ncbi:hypothetical protein BSK59_15790 [Paenibacillus odorifer]|uniref:YfaP family protein n=1 Tax=Paenibacillus odorifer TaxID=189426 RepID=UPI00096CFBFA|nr:hypothetical protein [Paenibacillus odorifer]OME54042.1 hypothetical protein BSK59_15790 [Paenibacillus odorifer]
MTNYTVTDSANDNYPHFSETIKEHFASFSDKPLFTTDTEDLFETFLAHLPEHARQHYNCNCCRRFINQFGGLVSINDKGKVTSVLWDADNTPEFFVEAVSVLQHVVNKAKVTGVFLSSDKNLGQPSSGGWEHMSVSLPSNKIHRDRLKTAGQMMAEKREDFGVLVRGLIEYPLDVVEQALTLLQSESLYRADRFVGNAQWLKDLHVKRQSRFQKVRDNVTWLAVATAPAGFTHVKNGMIGTLLDDIVSGYDVDSIIRRFAEKMGTYQRSQTPPPQGNILQAEKIVEKLGIANSLQRRYATIEEVPEFIWKGKEIEKQQAKSGGVFANVTAKAKERTSSNVVSLPDKTMTYDKFLRTVMPFADSMEVMVDNANRLMALVTASDETAPNILQWNNTFSWYYHGGIDGEIKRRVESQGGQYDNNEIRCSLIWESYTDLDLHAITPLGEHISFSDKRSRCGGWLDIDMNAGGRDSMTPVENIRWGNGQAREGKYQFFVHNFNERGNGNTPFKVELEVNGKIYTFSDTLRNKEKVVAFTFDYKKGQTPSITGVSYSSADAWGVPVNSFVKVKAVTTSPNLWGNEKVPHSGHHIFFLLEGAKDTSEGKGRGFFVETLKPELREVRKTLEAFTANTPIEDADIASACGVGYSKDSEWNLFVKVTTGTSTQLIKIDRWD